MKCDETTGIGRGLYAIGVALILLALSVPAAAGSPSALQARQCCFGTGRVSDDQRLDGCSAVLQANPSDALALVNRGI